MDEKSMRYFFLFCIIEYLHEYLDELIYVHVSCLRISSIKKYDVHELSNLYSLQTRQGTHS